MEISDTFRNLVTNKFIPDFDYNRNFPFETVFYKTEYSYACCPCAFQHEFFMYISEDGAIDEAIYDDIVSSIVTGRCKHVGQGVPDKWVSEASVYGLQIAVAVGTTKAEQDNMRRGGRVMGNLRLPVTRKQGVFQLSMHNIALMRKKYENLPRYIKLYLARVNFTDDDYVYSCHKQTGVYVILDVTKISLFEALVQTRDIRLIQSVLRFWAKHEHLEPKGRLAAFEYTLRHRLNDILTTLMGHDNIYCIKRWLWYMLSSILYSRPEILSQLLDCIINSETSKTEFTLTKQALPILSEALKRRECTQTLTEHGIEIKPDNSTDEQAIEVLLGFLTDDQIYEDFRDVIVAALKEIPDVQHKCIAMLSKNVYSTYWKPSVAKIVLELGQETFNQDVLTRMILPGENNIRAILQLLIYNNIDTQSSTDVVKGGLKRDLDRLLLRRRYKSDMEGVYFADAKERDVFTQEQCDLPMNFIGPLLLESGFSVPEHILKEHLDELRSSKYQHAECIRGYIQVYLENPKQLSVICRDTLRRYYKGRSLHTFVHSMVCPETIKDFILLKHVTKLR